MKSHLTDAEPRTCPICKETFIPLRRNQMFCSPPKRCRSTNQARILKRKHAATAGMLQPRTCSRCDAAYTPRRPDQKTCGINCPGKPDFTLTCANPPCGKQFTVKGNSHGKGNQRYCSAKCRDAESQWRLRQRFRRYDGMTIEDFRHRAAAQDGKCMICDRTPHPDNRARRDGVLALVVDHDHHTGSIRDLLCEDCNKGLGMFRDDPVLLRAAAAYIERHQ